MSDNLKGKAVTRLRLPVTDYSHTPIEVVSAQEGDEGSRVFLISLYDSRGDIDLSSYTSGKIISTSLEGKKLISVGSPVVPESESDIDLWMFQLSKEMLEGETRLSCNATFSNEDESMVLTSRAFYIIVSQTFGG